MWAYRVEMRHRKLGSRRSVAPSILVSGALLAGVAGVSPSSSAAPGDPEWLQVVNRYRATAGVGPVTENPAANAGAAKHAAYLVANRTSGHDESPNKKLFSNEGLRAGQTGNVVTGWGQPLRPQRELIEGWLTAPFHGLAILGSSYRSFGFGVAGNSKYWAASLPVFWDSYSAPSADGAEPDVDFKSAANKIYARFPEVDRNGWSAEGTADRILLKIGQRQFLVQGDVVRELGASEIAELVAAEVESARIHVWPGDGTSVPLVRYAGNEFPDPLTGCPGFTSNSGLPILIFGGPIEFDRITVTDDGGVRSKLCVLTAETFSAKDQGNTPFIRGLLRDAAIVMPGKPLTPGRAYRVEAQVTAREALDWTFRVSTTDAIGLPADHPQAALSVPGVAYQLKKTPLIPKRRG